MGGCRCSYRNCNVKSDGKTHMFHYPVFDRLRCHQWLLNAHKLDFLNLKVSQLRNRVVCQHHFKDDNFMNFKKDKLTFDAVPTESGPFCDPSQYAETNEENIQSFPLTTEDIENDSLLYCDKRANYSVKYGDFLTNSEINFMNTLKTDNITVEKEKRVPPVIIKEGQQYKDKLGVESDKIMASEAKKPVKLCVTPPVDKCVNNVLLPKGEIQVQGNDTCIRMDDQPTQADIPVTTIPLASENNAQKKGPKVKIISEKRIKDPIVLPKNLQTVSASAFIKILPKKNPQKVYSLDLSAQPSLDIGESASVIHPLKEKYVVNVQYDPPENQETQQTTQLPDKVDITSNKNGTTQLTPTTNASKPQVRPEMSKISLLKNKISPQRIAAIEEKRKFNMKLRDMIETCLDKRSLLKQQVSPIENIKADAKENKSNCIQKNFPKVRSSPSKKSEPPKTQEYAKYLDERLRRLENTLLNRIDQNTQQIVELKNSITQAPMKTASTSSQTLGNEECYKKYLFQEISKFLSPSSNSLVFEELFINKYSVEKSNNVQPSAKRRRCR